MCNAHCPPSHPMGITPYPTPSGSHWHHVNMHNIQCTLFDLNSHLHPFSLNGHDVQLPLEWTWWARFPATHWQVWQPLTPSSVEQVQCLAPTLHRMGTSPTHLDQTSQMICLLGCPKPFDHLTVPSDHLTISIWPSDHYLTYHLTIMWGLREHLTTIWPSDHTI